MISINRRSTAPYYQQIYARVAEDIRSGLYHAGERLPSIRQLATQLAVSRNTVEQAYLLLVQDGYVDAHPGSGYVVNNTEQKLELNSSFSDDYQRQLAELKALHGAGDAPKIVYDFAYDAMDPNVFPFAQWGRTMRDVLLSPQGSDICRYSDPRGLPELREQLAQYLIREQDIAAAPEQILVAPTTRTLIATILGLFDRTSTPIAMENPGYAEVANQCAAQGFTVLPQTVYPASSWPEFVRNDHGARLIYVTPANQYPTNAIMQLDNREALVAWAQKNDAYIIEDEYCHEFRYGTAHLPSLHALDPTGHVITIGTFSKSFAPGLCLCYAVLPPALMKRWLEPKNHKHALVPWHTQAAFASFIAEGHWYKHLRKVQGAARKKYRALANALVAHMCGKVEVLDYEAGLHMLIRPRDARPSSELLQAAAEHGVKLYPTDAHWMVDRPADWNFLLMGYSGIALADIEPGVAALAEAWFGEGA